MTTPGGELQRLAPKLWTGLLVALLAFHLLRAYQVNSQQPTDFKIFYAASRDFYTGSDPYASHPNLMPYPYSLFLPMAMGPLAAMPQIVAALVFTALSFGSWIALASLCTSWALRGPSPPRLLYWLPSLLAYRFVLRCTLHGQIDQMLILINFVGLALMGERRRRAGIALVALGFAIKPLFCLLLVYPGLVLGPAAWAEAAAFVAIWLTIPSVVTGPSRMIGLYRSFLSSQGMREFVDPTFEVGSANQCVYATLYRWIGGPDPRGVDVFPALGLVSSPGPIVALWAALGAFMVVATLYLLWRHRVDPLQAGPALILVTHIVFRRTWEYHLVTLVFVYCVLLSRALQLPPTDRRRRWLLALVGAAGVLTNFYSPLFLGKHLSLVVQGYGPTTLALILLWVASLIPWRIDLQKDSAASEALAG